MKIWHYVRDQTAQGPVSEAELHRFFRNGTLPADTLIWKEGMAEWSPYNQVFATSQAVARCAVSGREGPLDDMLQYGDQYVLPENKDVFLQNLREGGQRQQNVSSAHLFEYEDPRPRAAPLKFFFIAGILLEVGSTALGFLASDPEDVWNQMIGILALAMLVVFLTGVVFYCRWKHCVSRNAHVFSPNLLKFSPGWAVGYYFIPIFNLWKPYEAMREIWKQSQADRFGSSSIVGWWWAMWIISGLLGNVAFRAQLNEMPALALGAEVCSVIVAIPLLWSVLMVIKTINTAQVALAEEFPR